MADARVVVGAAGALLGYGLAEGSVRETLGEGLAYVTPNQHVGAVVAATSAIVCSFALLVAVVARIARTASALGRQRA